MWWFWQNVNFCLTPWKRAQGSAAETLNTFRHPAWAILCSWFRDNGLKIPVCLPKNRHRSGPMSVTVTPGRMNISGHRSLLITFLFPIMPIFNWIRKPQLPAAIFLQQKIPESICDRFRLIILKKWKLSEVFRR